MADTHVLDGVRVVDFTQFVAGPACTRLMAELGAEVIKIELAPDGDLCRVLPVIVDGRSGYFVQHNQGKKSVGLDIRQPEAVDLVRRLIARADVVVENFSPGVIARLGFGRDVVRALNPKAIMCSISAFGQEGPLRDLVGFDFIAQAYTGVTSMIGDPDGPPPIIGNAVGDVGTAISALSAINAALFHRERTGEAQFIDVALVDFYFHCHEINVQALTLSHGAMQPHRGGSHHPMVSPLGIFRAKTGYLLIIALGDQWARVCRAMGRTELIEDPRYVDPPARQRHQAEIVALIEDWLGSLDSDEAGMRALERERVPVAPILSVAEAAAHPHFAARGTVRPIVDRAAGAFSIPGMPFRFPEMPAVDGITAPFMGEHNAEVACGPGGLDRAAYDDLVARKVLVSARR